MDSRYAELLRSGRWFGALPGELQRDLLGAAVPRSLAAGERLFSRGDPPCGLYAVVEGNIRISGVSDTGKEVLLALIEPPGWFGELAVFDGDVRTHDAVAQTASIVVRVSQPALDALLAVHPQYWRDLGRLVTAKLRLLFATMEDAAVRPLGVRLARALLITARALGELHDRSRRVVELRQDQLATMLGTSRQTLNALLKDYEARGLVKVSYGQIEIVDFEGLSRAGDGERG